MKTLRKIIRWFLAIFFASTILSVVAYRFIPVWFTPLMFIRCAQQVSEGKEMKLSHHWVSINNISPSMPVAVIASEDANFLKHHGFDYKAIEHAAKRNREHPEKQKLGASTISQQTAKNVFLWPGRSWVRKGFEVYFTTLIELLWSKQRIMEVYLNSIEMGEGIYGVDAVAEEHFHLDAKSLSREQCALIAATLPNPRKFSSKNPSDYMLKRQARILKEMKFVSDFPK
ncbi:MAG: monofunctional biosynthetic peptidoglycan transglycosylase [Prevotella sp.]|jgi:monofunctional biosynthetic peptidoglycan transglycosylase|nr:monofunctional biosynthetic peptidoglycan transglycosylase [Prevotella sp.]